MELQNESAAIRSKLTFDKCRRAMMYARKAEIPTCPNDLEDAIDELENRRHSPLYQDMYIGHVSHVVPASKSLVLKVN